MIKSILILRYQSMTNFFRELGIIMSILVILLVVGSIVLFTRFPENIMPLILAAILIGIHFTRGDVSLLRVLFGNHHRKVFLVDYYGIALIFIVETLLLGHFKDCISCCLLPFIMAFIPSIHLEWKIPTNPFFSKGSIFYQSSFRILIFLYPFFLLASLMGTVYHNANIIYVCMLLLVFLLGCLTFQSVRPTYLFHYDSISWLIKLNVRFTFINSLILLAPFVILGLAEGQDRVSVLTCLKLLIGADLFLLQVYFLRFMLNNISILQSFLIFFFFAIYGMTMVYGYMIAVQIAIVAIMVYHLINRLNGVLKF
jgi:hypothetical protein